MALWYLVGSMEIVVRKWRAISLPMAFTPWNPEEPELFKIISVVENVLTS